MATYGSLIFSNDYIRMVDMSVPFGPALYELKFVADDGKYTYGKIGIVREPAIAERWIDTGDIADGALIHMEWVKGGE